MSLSPGAIFVNASGCLLDWLITRSWGRVLLLTIPGAVAATIIVMSVWGSLLDKDKIANWYLDLGEKELTKVDKDWAFGGTRFTLESKESGQSEKSSDKGNGSSATNSGNERSEQDDPLSSKGAADSVAQKTDVMVPRFAEAVFLRAQQLQPQNKRIVFVIAAMLGQRGSFTQAMALLKPYAPTDKTGYEPAHALLANMIIQQPRQLSNEEQQELKHHLQIAPRWGNTPPLLLAIAAQFSVNEKNFTRAGELLRQAAQASPMFYLEVLNLARALGNTHEAEEAAKKAEAYLREQIAKGEDRPNIRLALAQVLAPADASEEKIDEAKRILEEGLRKKESPELRRGLSEVWRLRYSQTIKPNPETRDWRGDEWLLDQALQIDPSNPGIAEEVAKLLRLGGEKPSDAYMEKLRDNLLKGTATPLTHAWLSEANILRGEYKEAVDHLRKVIARMPRAAARYRNNLAYALALAYPDQIEQAFEEAKIAITMEPQNPDFHDTLGFLFLKLNRPSEAITHLEYAIELAARQQYSTRNLMDYRKNLPDYHKRLAEAYKQEGNEAMAAKHFDRAEMLLKTLSAESLDAASDKKDPSSTTGNAPPKDSAAAKPASIDATNDTTVGSEIPAIELGPQEPPASQAKEPAKEPTKSASESPPKSPRAPAAKSTQPAKKSTRPVNSSPR